MFELGKDTDGKAVLDDGWSMFSTMKRLSVFLTYRSSETQTCSSCGIAGGPRGLEASRMWVFSNRDTAHDGDVNAAMNLLLEAEVAFVDELLVLTDVV
jgi:transposase